MQTWPSQVKPAQRVSGPHIGANARAIAVLKRGLCTSGTGGVLTQIPLAERAVGILDLQAVRKPAGKIAQQFLVEVLAGPQV